jgi:hypothetical protein
LSTGDKRKISNKNCGNEYEDSKLKQKRKWNINALSQQPNPETPLKRKIKDK